MKQAWSIIFYLESDKDNYRSFVLSPESRYKTPQEWEDGLDGKVIDWRAVSNEEYSIYFKEVIKPKLAEMAHELAKPTKPKGYGI